MSQTAATIIKMVENLKEFHQNVYKMRNLSFELFTHPSVTADQVLQAQQQLARCVAGYREVWKSVCGVVTALSRSNEFNVALQRRVEALKI